MISPRLGLACVTACFAAALCTVVAAAAAPGHLPIMGWSSWNSFKFHINETLVKTSADAMVESGLAASGYNYILIDDGWPLCLKRDATGKCAVNPPRNADGSIPVDAARFPSGMKALADYVHSKGLKIGIYTAVSAKTCGQYIASLGHEQVDGTTFAEWGMDFVKSDTCNTDCGIHDMCIQESTAKMRKALDGSGRKIVYYIDSGNPTSPQRVYNPANLGVTFDEALVKVATNPTELVWRWVQENNTADMWKSWFDRDDTWHSLLTNVHNQVRTGYYQSCGHIMTPDMLTIGMGGQSQGQYRAQMFLYAVLGAPLVLGNDIRAMDNFTFSLVTAPEVLAIDQDAACLQGSMVNAEGASEVWIKTLHTGEFAVVLLNKGSTAAEVSVEITSAVRWSDFYPACKPTCTFKIRDVYNRVDIPGTFSDTFSTQVAAMDAHMYRFTPLASSP